MVRPLEREFRLTLWSGNLRGARELISEANATLSWSGSRQIIKQRRLANIEKISRFFAYYIRYKYDTYQLDRSLKEEGLALLNTIEKHYQGTSLLISIADSKTRSLLFLKRAFSCIEEEGAPHRAVRHLLAT